MSTHYTHRYSIISIYLPTCLPNLSNLSIYLSTYLSIYLYIYPCVCVRVFQADPIILIWSHLCTWTPTVANGDDWFQQTAHHIPVLGILDFDPALKVHIPYSWTGYHRSTAAVPQGTGFQWLPWGVVGCRWAHLPSRFFLGRHFLRWLALTSAIEKTRQDATRMISLW